MSSRFPRSCRFFAPLAVVAVCSSCLLLAAPAHAGGPSLTLEASKKQLRPSQTTNLSGELSGVFSGDSGKTITLLATPYPYENESVATTTTTGANGKFSFPDVDPELNTRYRVTFDGDVLDGDATSESVQIFRFIRSDFDLGVTPDGFAEARFDLFYSPAVQPEYYVGRRDVHWYFRKTTQERAKRVGRSRFEDTTSGAGASFRYRLPRSRKQYRFVLSLCVEAPAADIGIGNDKPNKCKASFRARQPAVAARSYAP